MSENQQKSERQNLKQRPPKVDVSPEQILGTPTPTPHDSLNLLGDVSPEASISQLNQPQIPTVQRQMMAVQIGKLAGNRYLQQILTQQIQPPTGTPTGRESRGVSTHNLSSRFGDDRSPLSIQQAGQDINPTFAKNPALEDVQRQPEQPAESGANQTGIAKIKKILKNWWVGPGDESEIEGIWAGFGDKLPAMFTQHRQLWFECMDRGAELDDLPQVERAREKFKSDVKALALKYLSTNLGCDHG